MANLHEFSFRQTKSGKVFIYWRGKQVMILSDPESKKFLRKINGLDDKHIQLIMAKITCNFKRGNERLAAEKGKNP